MPGPKLVEKEWKKVLDSLEDLEPKPDYIVASGSTPQGVPDIFYQKIAEIAKELETRLIVDTSGKALKKAAESGVYLLKPNM